MNYKDRYTFIDLFAGVGGFHLAMHNLGHECVFSSEINPHARKTYEHNFKRISPYLFEKHNGAEGTYFNADIIKQPPEHVPEHDILCAGFPCQPFSQAGYKRGFGENADARGNMFFVICDIIKAKKPKAIFLENVRHLLKHDNGRTFEIIKRTIKELGYSFDAKVFKATDFGLPQHRPRIYMVGFRNDIQSFQEFSFPEPKGKLDFTMSDVFGGVCNKEVGFTLRVGGKGSGINDRRNWDCYIVNDKQVRLSPEHGKKMMGFPADFEFPVSDTEALKQLGNSVAVPVIQAIGQQIVLTLNAADGVKSFEPTKIKA